MGHPVVEGLCLLLCPVNSGILQPVPRVAAGLGMWFCVWTSVHMRTGVQQRPAGSCKGKGQEAEACWPLAEESLDPVWLK